MGRPTIRILAAACAATLLLGACGRSTPAPGTTPSTGGVLSSAPSSSHLPPLGSIHVRLTMVATLDSPLALAVRAGDTALYVAEQTGRVMAIREGTVDSTPVLDLRGQIVSGGEQGLLGLAFSPDGGFVYVDYTDLQGNTNVVEFAMDADDRAVVSSRREVLFVHQPFANHNGGNLAFGPDGDLYVALGDGGGGGDPLHNGQSLSTLLAKILRIDPRPGGQPPPDGRGYAVPDGNPFVGVAGARPEIWAFGLRNPWRFSFDRATGDLWIGDVGQGAWEEVDRQPADSAGGQNYGWNRLEGTHAFQGSAPSDAVPPVFEYSHDGGCAVTGGFVYRGSAIPRLRGVYVFGDFCQGNVMGLRLIAGRPVVGRLGPHVDSLSSFGQDSDGELYAMSLSGGVYRLDPA
jgi:glucose/arabinose dehydrogenase